MMEKVKWIKEYVVENKKLACLFIIPIICLSTIVILNIISFKQEIPLVLQTQDTDIITNRLERIENQIISINNKISER